MTSNFRTCLMAGESLISHDLRSTGSLPASHAEIDQCLALQSTFFKQAAQHFAPVQTEYISTDCFLRVASTEVQPPSLSHYLQTVAGGLACLEATDVAKSCTARSLTVGG